MSAGGSGRGVNGDRDVGEMVQFAGGSRRGV